MLPLLGILLSQTALRIIFVPRLHPFYQTGSSSRKHGRSISPNIGPAKSMSEEGSEKENQSYTTSSLQLLDLMDTLFSRYGCSESYFERNIVLHGQLLCIHRQRSPRFLFCAHARTHARTHAHKN